MSTQALYTFKDEQGEFHVYKYHDGYPTGALSFIEAAKTKAWPLPGFEADEFAAAFVAANKDGGGGVRLVLGKTWMQAAPMDIEYHYVVTMKATQLWVEVSAVSCEGGFDNKPVKWHVTKLHADYLQECTMWAKRKENA